MSKKSLHFGMLYAVTGLLFYLVTIVGWHLMPNGIWGLYSLSDGAWSVWHATSIFTWGKPFDLSPYSFLQGLGSLYPPNTPWLNPGALALSLPGELSTRYYLSYSIYFLELLVSTIVLGRSLGLSLVRSTIVAQLLCLMIFPPYSGYFLTLPYISLGPFYAHMISMFALLLALFQPLGRTGTRNNILIVLGMITAIASAVYTAAIQFTTFVPVYALFGIAVLTHEPNIKSLGWKLGTAAGLLLLSYLLGFPDYYIGTAEVSSSSLLTPPFTATIGIETLRDFIQEWNTIDWCYFSQAFLCSGYPIVYLHAAAFAGAAVSIAVGRGLERRLALAMVLLVAVLYVWPVAARIGLLGKLARVSQHYFLFAAYPFFAFFVVSLVAHLLRCSRTAYQRLLSPALQLLWSWLRRPWTQTPNFEILRAHTKKGFASYVNRTAEILGSSAPMFGWTSLLAVPAAAIWIMYTIDEPRLNAFKKTSLSVLVGSTQRINTSDLVEHGDRAILRINGKEHSVQPGLAGSIEHVDKSDKVVTFTGWAIDEEAGASASDVLIYIDSRLWAKGTPGKARPDIAAMNPKYRQSGFDVTAYTTGVLPWNLVRVRAFAVMKNGMARELRYSEGYPFSTMRGHIDTHFPPAAIEQPLAYLPPATIQQPIGNVITETLEREIGLKPGGTFNGFATNYFGGQEGALRAKLGVDRDAPFFPGIYIDSRFYLEAVYGNSFMMTDLWARNIPTLSEYGQWITKPLYVFAKEMFASQRDTPAWHEINLYRLNLKWLRALGVRFLISDAELHDPRLRLRTTLRLDPEALPARTEVAGYAKSPVKILSAPLLPVFLYEVTGSNLASFSPTFVDYASTAGDILQILQDEKFDPSAHVVVNERLPDSQYHPATASSMTVSRGHLRVKARSEGTSILLLPIQFSHCFRVESHLSKSNTAPHLMRANLVQSAIVFMHELDADLTFVFGPGRDARCRRADMDDFQRLDFTRWSDPTPFYLRH